MIQPQGRREQWTMDFARLLSLLFTENCMVTRANATSDELSVIYMTSPSLKHTCMSRSRGLVLAQMCSLLDELQDAQNWCLPPCEFKAVQLPLPLPPNCFMYKENYLVTISCLLSPVPLYFSASVFSGIHSSRISFLLTGYKILRVLRCIY